MRKIVITVPDKKARKWKVSMFGSRGKTRASATTSFLLVEKALNTKENLNPEARLKEKTAVRVNYGQHFINESLDSDRPGYFLYCLACFLEEYLSRETFKKKQRGYGSEGWRYQHEE